MIPDVTPPVPRVRLYEMKFTMQPVDYRYTSIDGIEADREGHAGLAGRRILGGVRRKVQGLTRGKAFTLNQFLGETVQAVREKVLRQTGDYVLTVQGEIPVSRERWGIGRVIQSEKSHRKVCHDSSVSGYGSVTVLVTTHNLS